MDPDGNGIQLFCLESIVALEGGLSSQHFHRGATKIQGWSLPVPDLISLLLNRNIWVRQTEHKLGGLEACLTA